MVLRGEHVHGAKCTDDSGTQDNVTTGNKTEQQGIKCRASNPKAFPKDESANVRQRRL